MLELCKVAMDWNIKEIEHSLNLNRYIIIQSNLEFSPWSEEEVLFSDYFKTLLTPSLLAFCVLGISGNNIG